MCCVRKTLYKWDNCFFSWEWNLAGLSFFHGAQCQCRHGSLYQEPISEWPRTAGAEHVTPYPRDSKVQVGLASLWCGHQVQEAACLHAKVEVESHGQTHAPSSNHKNCQRPRGLPGAVTRCHRAKRLAPGFVTGTKWPQLLKLSFWHLLWYLLFCCFRFTFKHFPAVAQVGWYGSKPTEKAGWGPQGEGQLMDLPSVHFH